MMTMPRLKFVFTLILLMKIRGSNGVAREFQSGHRVEYQCSFCKCSKSSLELKQNVSCKSISLEKVTDSLNNRNVSTLHLENINDFHYIEPYFLNESKIQGLIIRGNILHEISEKAFFGLRVSLKELEISECGLQTVPIAVSNLPKLKILDLSGNRITMRFSNTWSGFQNSLEKLILANNTIKSLTDDAFIDLSMLKTLDLRGNSISNIDANAFAKGIDGLNTLILSDNLLHSIPYKEIFLLKQLQHLNLSKNQITHILPYQFKNIMSLNTLRLENNFINSITNDAFNYFNKINTLILDGNPIEYIMANAFYSTNITTISLRKCNLMEISFNAFTGLESTLQSIILSAEHVNLIPKNSLFNFKLLNYLVIDENRPQLKLSKNVITRLPSGVLQYINDLEILYINKNHIQNLTGNTIRGLKKLVLLDLSENEIEYIDPNVFYDSSNIKTLSLSNNNFESFPSELLIQIDQLESFYLRNNFKTIRKLPNGFLCNLKSLTDVNLEYSNVKEMEEGVFWGSKQIKKIFLSHNLLETIPSALFKDQINLQLLDLNHNKLSHISNDAFSSLRNLNTLELSYNHLKNIEVKSCVLLKTLLMSNNELHEISTDSFESNNSLEYIDFSFNNLTLSQTNHEPMWWDMESALNSLMNLKFINLSHNRINIMFQDWKNYDLNLIHLDLSYNLFTEIEFEDLLFQNKNVKIDLRHNNIAKINFGNMMNSEIYHNHLLRDAYNNLISSNIIVFIEHNPLNCDCKMYDFVRYMRKEIIPEVQSLFTIESGNAKCHLPLSLEDKLLKTLDKCDVMCSVDRPESKISLCPKNCKCFIRECDKYQLIECSAQNMKLPMNFPVFKEYKDLELNFENSSLNSIVSLGLNKSTLNSIKKLYVSGNNISKLTVDDIPNNLTAIDLRNNHLTYVDTDVVNKLGNASLQAMYFSGNPIMCDCKNLQFLTFLQDKYSLIKDLKDVKCQNGDSVHTILIGNLCSISKELIAGIVILALFVFIIGIAAALYYKYQQEIKVWLFAKGWLLRWITDIDEDKTYDAFLSWSHKDDDFVINKLLPELESGPNPFKICVHYRDWVVGEMISTQITRTIMDSKRTIVVLSPNFLESVWGILEFKIAHCRALEEGRTRVIVIRYGDIGPTEKLDEELQAYLSTNTYLEWGDPRFWQKLRYALPHATIKKRYNYPNIHNNIEKMPSVKLQEIHRKSSTTPLKNGQV